MEKNKKRNELSIFEEFRIKPEISNNKRLSQFLPKDDELKQLNVLCEVNENNEPISWWKKIGDKIVQVDELGQLIDSSNEKYLDKIPDEKNLKKNKSKIWVTTTGEFNIIKDYWIKDKNNKLIQINIKEKLSSLNLEQSVKSWIRDKAIEAVGHEVRSMKKKVYEYSKTELMELIEAEENKIVKENGLKAIKVAALSALGLSWLPFI